MSNHPREPRLNIFIGLVFEAHKKVGSATGLAALLALFLAELLKRLLE